MAFAAHLLDQDGDLHLAASGDGEDLRIAGLCDAQRDVGPDLLHQAVPDVAGRDELAVLSGERAVIDGELHLNGRRVDGDVGQGGARLAVAQRLTDEDVLETGHTHDVTGTGLVDLDALHAFEVVEHGDLALGDLAVAMAANG